MSLELPQQLGRYNIVGRLARGGMAEILLARLTGPSGFERAVVVKRILPALAQDPAFVDMFLDEGRLAARIHHPNVVQVQELQREEGELYLVMEFLEGESAAGILRRARARRLAISPVLAAHIVAEAAAGLHAAHELTDSDGAPLGVVHRDVSPQNIFVGYDGSVKILDFGIAKAADRITRTEAGALKGKFEYMSPEQALGEKLDQRSDLFALGTVFYELLTSRRLFRRGTQLATLRAVTDDPIPRPSTFLPELAPALERVCMKALARQKSERYETATDLRRDILSALRTIEGPAMPEEALAALMQELFDGRVEEKREMLAHMRSGITPSHVPVADVDVAIELPTVEAKVASEGLNPPMESGQPRRRHRLVAALGVLGLAAASTAVALAVRATPSEQEPVPPAIAAATSELVEVTVHSQPAGARISVDDVAYGVTPLSLELPRGDGPVRVRLEAAGHESLTERVTPDVDQRIQLVLTPSAETAAVEEENEPQVARGERRRRRRRARPTSAEPPEREAPGAAETSEPETNDGRARAFRRLH